MKHLLLTLILLPTITLSQSSHLEIVGQGRLTATPDIGIFHITISEIRNGFGESIEALSIKENQVNELIESLGYSSKDIKNSQYSVSANSVWKRGQRYDSGYYAHEQLSIEFQNDKSNIAELINAFSQNDIKTEITFTFKLSDELRTKVREQVIVEAVKDAESKAKIISKSKNLTLGKVLSIKYGNIPSESPFFISEDFEDILEVPATHQSSLSRGFSVKDFVITDKVLIKYELKNN
ncbi:MAG: SIMPL domain-containing protein [Ekhidna sp.]|nr:SIMPL domain-containing protein [Ekhidna sp.]